jgi:hypothetical protein
MAIALGTTALSTGQVAASAVQNSDNTWSIQNAAGLYASCDPNGILTWTAGPPSAYQKGALNGPVATATIFTFTPDGQHTFDFSFHGSVYSY